MITLPGFADPVVQAQSCFRAVLDAMSRPGTLHRAGAGLTPPPPLDPATAAVLLTLADGETAVAIDPCFAPAAAWIAFHCGVAPDAAPAAADFVLAATLPALAGLPTGSDEMPEASATIILQLAGLGQGRDYLLAGPGLQHPTRFAADGLPADFTARWAANHALYPRGIDLILCAGNQLAALPRSLRITEG